MKSFNFSPNILINSTVIFSDKNLTLLNKSEQYVKIDDFQNTFNSFEFKIIWFLSWVVFQSFSNAYNFFIIRFEKYGGEMTLCYGDQANIS